MAFLSFANLPLLFPVMSNRFLSLIIIILILSGLFGLYYYFFMASNAHITISIVGSGTTAVVLDSEFGKIYTQECQNTCKFENIPAVQYTLSLTQTWYISLQEIFKLSRGEDKKFSFLMKKTIKLSEWKKDKTELISLIKLKKTFADILQENTGSILLGYRDGKWYFAVPNKKNFDIYSIREWEKAKQIFQIPWGILTSESLDFYEWYIALKKDENIFFYALQNGQEISFPLHGNIFGVKDTSDKNIKIITSNTGVFMYSMEEKITRINPLYDDIIILASGEMVALVKKNSREKQSLLSFSDTAHDTIFLIKKDTRERTLIFRTQENSKMLRYIQGEILLVQNDNTVSVIQNVQ